MIGGFNSYMGGMKGSGKAVSKGLAGVFGAAKAKSKPAPKKAMGGPVAAKRFVDSALARRTVAPRAAAARQVQQRAGAARTVNQGRVIAAQRKAAARGRGR